MIWFRVTLWVGLLYMDGVAQVYHIDKLFAPASGSLEAHYAFYVYVSSDSPDKSSGKEATVEFKNLEAHPSTTERSDSDLYSYAGVQISLINVAEFEEIVDPNAFCDGGKLKTQHDQKDLAPVLSSTAMVPRKKGDAAPEGGPFHVTRTGVYFLVLSNCGEISGINISGDVVVSQTYGYMPANEYHKKSFFTAMTVAYSFLALAWASVCLKHRTKIIGIQHGLSFVLFLALVESIMWVILLNWWNNEGIVPQKLLAATLYSSTAKRLYSFVIVLLASMGWGVTQQDIPTRTTIQILIAGALYFSASLFQEFVFFYRHSLMIKTTFLILVSLPAAVWCGMVFCWIFCELRSTVEELALRRQTEKWQLYNRFQSVLCGAVAVGSLTLLFQGIDAWTAVTKRWFYQWFPNVAVSQITFFAVLAAFAMLWAPHEGSDVYAYTYQVNTDDADGVTWADEEDDDEDWLKGNSVAPEPIGANTS